MSTAEERFEFEKFSGRFVADCASGCWLWTGAKNHKKS